MKFILDYSSGEAFFAVLDNEDVVLTARKPFSPREAGALVQWIRDVAANAGIDWSQITEWLTGTGPGSFTSLRTAAAVVSGLAAGSEKGTVSGVPSALGLLSFFTDGVHENDTASVIYDGRNQELLYFGAVFSDGFWIPNGDNGIIETTQLPALAARFGQVVSLEANRPLLAHYPQIHYAPYTDGVSMACNPCRTACTDLVYLRPAVFVSPQKVREVI